MIDISLFLPTSLQTNATAAPPPSFALCECPRCEHTWQSSDAVSQCDHCGLGPVYPYASVGDIDPVCGF